MKKELLKLNLSIGRRRKIKLFLSFFLANIFLSCGCSNSKHFSSEFYDLIHSDISNRQEFLYQPFITNEKVLTDKFDISLIVRYDEKCKIKELPLKFVSYSLFRDSVTEKNLVIPLFEDNGEIIGKGNFGLYETSIIIENNLPFEKDYYFTILPETDLIEGIVAIGMICEKINQ